MYPVSRLLFLCLRHLDPRRYDAILAAGAAEGEKKGRDKPLRSRISMLLVYSDFSLSPLRRRFTPARGPAAHAVRARRAPTANPTTVRELLRTTHGNRPRARDCRFHRARPARGARRTGPL